MKNIENFKNIFMKQTYEDTWNYYCKTINDNNYCNWDWIILTASNDEQANTYREEIEYRLNKGWLPKYTKYAVIPDVNGKRIGSGGATLNVLKYIKENSNEEDAFENKKILIIHSGGDSKRVPQYSASGKLFSPVQRELPDGRTSTLFDEFIITFSAIPSRMSPGIILLSGDVLLVFNPLQVDLNYFDSACISIKTPVEIGCNHGVFLEDENKNVKQFLHKQTVDRLKELGATNEKNFVNIDTGAIFLSDKVVKELFSLISVKNNIDKTKFNKFVNEKARISLYGDFVYPLATNSTLEDYLIQTPEGELCNELLECRNIIWEKLSKFKMRIIKLSPAEFIHFGTTKELLKLVTENLNKYKYLNWKRRVLSNITSNTNYSVNNSYIDETAIINKNCYIENSYIGKNCKVGKQTILSNVQIEDASIPEKVCLNTLILKNNKYVTRIYSVYDNPKTVKSLNTEFLNTTLEKALNKYKIKDELIWDSNDKSIWKANLFQICDTSKESIKAALTLYDIIYGISDKKTATNYFKQNRTSLYKSFQDCNTSSMKKKSKDIEIKLRTANVINLIKSRENSYSIIKIIEQSADIEQQIENIISSMKNLPYEMKYRIYLTLSLLLKKIKILNYSSLDFENLCYKEIKNMITFEDKKEEQTSKFADFIDIEAPIRVNFGGGWSDTPPYCNEEGGSVLNAAFKLNEENPIKVHIEKNNESAIILESKDLNIRKTITDINDIKNCYNVNDVFALHKASLIISGIVKNDDKSVKNIISRIGSGITFTTNVKNIPKGSGLGTSSILSGACLKALYAFKQVKISEEELCYKVLEQEQLMGTGGGWQDQIGGMISGFKLTTTKPGYIQKFNIEKLNLQKDFIDEINNKTLLIYTGQRRLAKNLLRNIMNKFICSDKATINTIRKIKELSVKMTNALKNENLKEFSQLMNSHWELSKKLDQGCTNTCINQILLVCDDLIQGKMICGAGGGGFLQVILKENVTKKDIDERIKNVFQDSGIKTYKLTLC